MLTEPKTGGKVLKKGGLAVARVTAQHNQSNLPLHYVGIKSLFQSGFDVCVRGERGVQSARFLISPTR
jgi:hypothetical protein